MILVNILGSRVLQNCNFSNKTTLEVEPLLSYAFNSCIRKIVHLKKWDWSESKRTINSAICSLVTKHFKTRLAAAKRWDGTECQTQLLNYVASAWMCGMLRIETSHSLLEYLWHGVWLSRAALGSASTLISWAHLGMTTFHTVLSYLPCHAPHVKAILASNIACKRAFAQNTDGSDSNDQQGDQLRLFPGR